MRTIISILCVSLLTLGCNINPNVEPKPSAEQNMANNAVNNIIYINDPRTDTCFALMYYAGGPAMATVPCKNIPPHLLVIAEANK